MLGVDSLVLPPERRLADNTEPLQALRIVYAATVTGGELANELDGSTDEARWFALDAIPEDRVTLVDIGLRMRAAP